MKRPALDTVLVGDNVQILQKFPDECVDMVFADPPYFLQLSKELVRPDDTCVKGVRGEDWDNFKDLQAYEQYTISWLAEVRRVLKQNGSLWIIGSYHNIFLLGAVLQKMGFWILNDIAWIKTNPMPNFHGTRFTNAHETMIWCAKDKNAKYTFNYETMKGLNDDMQMRSDWNIPICLGAERLKDERNKSLHPTQKPEALLYRVIMASTNPKDIILDPFLGTGTTAAVAKRLGRHFIGIEKEKKYAQKAQNRIDAVQPLSEKMGLLTPVTVAPKIPFGTLVENDKVLVGEKVYGLRGKIQATVRADGLLQYKDKILSIHQMAAFVRQNGTKSLNGWLFWSVVRQGEHVLLDEVRQEFLKSACNLKETDVTLKKRQKNETNRTTI